MRRDDLLRDLPEIARRLAGGDRQTAATLVDGIAEKPFERIPRGTIGPHIHAEVWARDEFTCGYCQRPVIPPIVMRCISAHFRDEFTYQRNWKGAHSAYWTISASTDHRNPYSRRGNSDVWNLVCASWACNQRKGNLNEEEAGMHYKQPAKTPWVGLTDVYPALILALDPPERQAHKPWLSAFLRQGLCQAS